MPWELQVSAADGGESMGWVDEVQATLRAAVPGIVFLRGIGGAEKIAAMEAQGVEVPDVIREHWLASKGAHLGHFEGQDVTIEFDFGEDEAKVAAILVEVRGGGDPMPVVRRLTEIDGWAVVDARGGPPTAESWQEFGTWRDEAVRQVDDGES
jgi:hypothetical protein